jgi:hypothetical protein
MWDVVCKPLLSDSDRIYHERIKIDNAYPTGDRI